MAVLVEKVMMSKSGKALRVLLGPNGQTWYNAALNSGLNGMAGKMIEAEIETHEKFGPGIKAWKPSATQNAAPQPSAQASAPPSSPSVAGAAPATPSTPRYAEPSQAPWWGPMASNVIAHAIAAGKLENPNQVGIWFNAVRMAAEGKSSEVDEDIPF